MGVGRGGQTGWEGERAGGWTGSSTTFILKDKRCDGRTGGWELECWDCPGSGILYILITLHVYIGWILI